MLIHSKNDEIIKFVKEAYKIVSASMKIPYEELPIFIHTRLNKLEKLSNNDFKDICEQQGFNKLFEGVNKLLSKGEITGVFIMSKELRNGLILLNSNKTRNKELGFILGEELFHKVNYYYNKKEEFPEFFGFMGRFFLYNLFIRYKREEYLKFFKNKRLLREVRKTNVNKVIKKVNDSLEKAIQEGKNIEQMVNVLENLVGHGPEYEMANLLLIKKRLPPLDIAINNPEKFFKSNPKEIINLAYEWSKLSTKERISEIITKHKEITKKL